MLGKQFLLRGGSGGVVVDACGRMALVDLLFLCLECFRNQWSYFAVSVD
jgi:hypothetical protein